MAPQEMMQTLKADNCFQRTQKEQCSEIPRVAFTGMCFICETNLSQSVIMSSGIFGHLIYIGIRKIYALKTLTG